MFGLSVFGQTTKADLEQLRKEVGLPASVSINDNDVSFPQATPIKIYLAIKYDKKSAREFKEWVTEWNQTKAAEFGEIQIVNNINDADIAAVQYQFGVGKVVREDSIEFRTGNIPREDERDRIERNNRIVLSSIGNSKVRAEKSAKILTLPLYSYLIVRGEDSSWSVDYSRVDDKTSFRDFPDRLLRSAIESKLKNR